MKNSAIVLGLSSVLLLSSCTSTGSGALSGAMVGGWFGSAIGGIMGGPHGHDVGTVLGMATGAAVGAASVAAEEQRQQERIESYHQRVASRDYSGRYSRNNNTYSGDTYTTTSTDNSGFDSTNSGDDRIDFQSSVTDTAKVVTASTGSFVLKNIHFVDSNGDGVLQRQEFGKISFEIKNISSQMQYDLIPSVVESTGNTHVVISPAAHIENIAPGQTLRYTAMVKADSSLRDGSVTFKVSINHLGKCEGNELFVTVPSSKVRISN